MKNSDHTPQPELKNYDEAHKKHPWLTAPAIDKRVNQIFNSDATFSVKRKRIIQIVDQVNEALAPHVACKSGCSHCCHIALVITENEAQAISKFVGVPYADLGQPDPDEIGKGTAAYRGVVCPFLLEHKCSIYSVRPVACRAHHSLNDDAVQCDLSTPSDESSVPKFNLKSSEFGLAFISIRLKESMGDIRDFFPVNTLQK